MTQENTNNTASVAPTPNTIGVYLCGGLGINVISKTLRNISDTGSAQSGFAFVKPYYLDTSDANMRPDMENKYVFTDTDNSPLSGAGKQRGSVVSAVSARAKQVVAMYPPEEFNIIVHSLTGGKQVA